jgi:hypothetical protein
MSKINDSMQPGVHFFICPGCNCAHWFSTSGFTPSQALTDTVPKGPVWTWNGDREKPTIRASILTKHVKNPPGDPSTWVFENNKAVGCKKIICHSFITDGKIQYLPDSNHELSGQTVELPDWDQKDQED